MNNLAKTISILEDGKLSAFTFDNEEIYLQPKIVVDTLDDAAIIRVRGVDGNVLNCNVTIETIDGVPFVGSFAALETALREMANKANSTAIGVENLSDVATETTLLQTNLKLDQLILNTGGDYSDFSYSNGTTEVDLGVAGGERLLLLFRCDTAEVDVLIKNMNVSISSSTNDDFLAILSVAKIFDHSFIEDNFKDVDVNSKIQVAVPGLEGVPASVTATGFSVGGRNVFQQFGKSQTTISLTNDNPATIPGGVYYALTAIGFSANAKLSSSANFAELQ